MGPVLDGDSSVKTVGEGDGPIVLRVSRLVVSTEINTGIQASKL